MRRAVFASLALALAVPALAAPQGTIILGREPVVFVAVDAVQLYGYNLYVTGVVEGDAQATSRYVMFSLGSSSGESIVQSLESCQRFALAMMERPGRYRLELTAEHTSSASCRLSRINP